MLSLPFFMIFIRQLFSAFATQKTISEQDNQYKIMRFEFRFLETHHSTIPLFQHSIILRLRRMSEANLVHDWLVVDYRWKAKDVSIR